LAITDGGKETIEVGLRTLPYRDGDEFGYIIGVKFAHAQFDHGKKLLRSRVTNLLIKYETPPL
jgi:hypothetical protein